MSIIGISGRIGVGKDVTGRIIQYLTSEYKDNYEYSDWIDRVENYGSKTYSPWEIKKFAGKLKQIASLLTGIPVEDFEDQEFKKSYLGAEWGTVESNPLNSIPVFENIEFNHLMSVREFLQKLGTDAMRDNLHTNVWVNALFTDYKPTDSNWNDSLLKHKKENMFYPNWIITDMRFPNEMEAVVKRNGITIRVQRFEQISENIRVHGTGVPHPSETALDKAKFDYEIINDAGIPELIEKVRQILITEKII